jgi:hypothetical protein
MARPKTVRRLRRQVASLEGELKYVKSQFDACRVDLHDLQGYYPDKIAELENVIRDLLAQVGKKEMTEDEVVKLMSSSRYESDWNDKANSVKAAFGGDYPDFWCRAIIQSGVRAVTSMWWSK